MTCPVLLLYFKVLVTYLELNSLSDTAASPGVYPQWCVNRDVISVMSAFSVFGALISRRLPPSFSPTGSCAPLLCSEHHGASGPSCSSVTGHSFRLSHVASILLGPQSEISHTAPLPRHPAPAPMLSVSPQPPKLKLRSAPRNPGIRRKTKIKQEQPSLWGLYVLSSQGPLDS